MPEIPRTSAFFPSFEGVSLSAWSGKLLVVSEWLMFLLMSLGAWCFVSFVLGLLIAPLLRKRDLLSDVLTAFAMQRGGGVTSK